MTAAAGSALGIQSDKATAAASRLALNRLILYLLCMVAYYLPDGEWPSGP